MAEVPFVYSRLGKGAYKITWPDLGGTDTGAWWGDPHVGDRSIELSGTVGTGLAGQVEGSNVDPPVAGNILIDASDPPQPLTFAAVGNKQVLNLTEFIRPVNTAGTGTSVTYTLVSKERK